MINAFYPGAACELEPDQRRLIERRTRVLGPAYRLFYDQPVHFVRGAGTRLYDPSGAAYLDCYNNVVSVGHCHPAVAEAIARQSILLNTHTRYLHEGVVEYAERLLATFPAQLGQVMFTCTGSEANDLALRIARFCTDGTGVIVTSLAYHGVTAAVAECSPSLGPGVPLWRDVRAVPPPDIYRNGPDAPARFHSDIAAAFDDMRRHGIRPAALLLDSMFTSDGIFPEPAGMLRGAVEAARSAGALVIADEVQAGFGRTGRMWGFERHGIDPDLVTLGKPMGNGHPIAGVVARPELLDRFGAEARYFNTFGGNPVSVAAGQAVLDVLLGDDLAGNARLVGDALGRALRGMRDRHAAIGDVRWAGLMLAVELVAEGTMQKPAGELTRRVVNGLRHRRVLVSACGPGANILKVRPPLTFSLADAGELVDALDGVLSDGG